MRGTGLSSAAMMTLPVALHRAVGRALGRATIVATIAATFAGGAGLALAATPGPDALPIAVLGVESEDALDQAEAFTQVLRKAVRESGGWSLGESTQSLEFLVLQMKCTKPIDSACEARIADVIQADRFLWSVVQFTDKTQSAVKGSLNLFVRGRGTSRTELDFSANMTDPNDHTLLAYAVAALEKATGGAPNGTVKITTTGGVAAQLFIDDKPVGALADAGGSFPLPSGSHKISVKAPGYADAVQTIVVRPETTVEVTLTMTPVEPDSPVDARMIAGFATIGVGAAAGAVGLWAALDVNSIRADAGFEAYRGAVLESQNACHIARNGGLPNRPAGASADSDVESFCDRADTAELIQAITFPAAAIAVGVGSYLLGTSSLGSGGSDATETKPSALSVVPMIGPGQQSLHLSYRF